ncbi:hypothetical protein VNO80_24992 [Phaseolus coccineus]|uniref:Uncharacterized protein n=1 Tax=Phaseolus coccineus TaxID=3886 RepID=A0AAN9QLJ4_PHACN
MHMAKLGTVRQGTETMALLLISPLGSGTRTVRGVPIASSSQHKLDSANEDDDSRRNATSRGKERSFFFSMIEVYGEEERATHMTTQVNSDQGSRLLEKRRSTSCSTTSQSSPSEQIYKITTRSRERARAAVTTSRKGGMTEEEKDDDDIRRSMFTKMGRSMKTMTMVEEEDNDAVVKLLAIYEHAGEGGKANSNASRRCLTKIVLVE